MARKLASRDAGTYDNKVHGGFEGGGGPPGNYMLQPGVGNVNIVFPSWKDGPCVFRPFPHMDFKEPQNKLQPGRLAPEPKAYSQWIVKVRAVSFTGLPDCDKVSFLLYQPGADDEVKRVNPYLVFYKACEQAKKSARFGNGKKWDSDWNKFMEGKKNEGAALKEDTYLYFLQGAMFCSGQRDYMENRTTPYGLDAKDRLPVLQLPMSAGIGISNLFDLEKEEFDGDAESDFSLPFVFGDPVGKFLAAKQIVKGGYIIKVYNPAVTKIKQAKNNSWDGPPKEGEKAKIRYCAELLEEYEHNGEKYTPRLDANATKQVFEKSQFWFDDKKSKEKGLLRFASPEEQTAWIAKAFKAAPRLVTWAFSEHEEYLTDEVKGILAARASVVIPGKGDEDEDGDEEVTKKKVKKTDPTVKKSKPVDDDEDEDEDEDDDADDDDEEEEEEKPAKKGSKKAKPADDDDDEEEEEEDEDEDEEDEDEEEEEKPAKKSAAKPSKKKDEEEDDDEEEEDEDEEEDDEDDEEEEEEDDDEEEKPAKKSSKKPETKPSKKAKPVDDDEEEEDEDEEEEDEEDDEEEDEKPAKKAATKPSKKPEPKKEEAKPKKKGKADDDDDLFEDDDDKGTKKSLKAADKAKDRSEKRKTPDKPAPKPPTSKGGTAKKK